LTSHAVFDGGCQLQAICRSRLHIKETPAWTRMLT